MIERWFFFITWKDIVNVGLDGYMGIVLFDGPEQGAALNWPGRGLSRASPSVPTGASAEASVQRVWQYRYASGRVGAAPST